ncbi:ribosome biogenesis/translation initiation ATPase RLI [archaeon CG10_big_fil_rev_8_21_14_0_10_43_11]|nr:MAG: ribosome biogenesis/translation initiation ATPase RLI [archaeon CG10_big_fil_rev_8_21_14_0_10_43_11]
MRIAIVDPEICTPDKCSFECHNFCPKVRAGAKETVQLKDNLSVIDEELCIGCGICAAKCPFGAIKIINLPEMKENPLHQYGQNAFRVFNFPQPKRGSVVGLLGPNGIGKTTILHVLNGTIRPNLGKEEATDQDIFQRFRGTETQNYFKTLFATGLKVAYKPQYVDDIPKVFKGNVQELLKNVDERGAFEEVTKSMDITPILNSNIAHISGGELQKVAIAATLLKDADYYFFDEPTSFLDVKERLRIATLIRERADKGKGVFVVEHDLVVLDYLADIVHIMYGTPGVYGVVSTPLSTKDGINTYLKGYLRTENIRFRDYEIKFMTKPATKSVQKHTLLAWDDGEKHFDLFSLTITSGTAHEEEVIGIVGANGTGKTTFVNILAGEIKADKGNFDKKARVSYKPQHLPRDEQNVFSFLSSHIKLNSSSFKTINQHLNIERLYERTISQLSGGELQQVHIALTLCADADVYLLDEPSAYLDVEQRINVAKAIKSVLQLNAKTAFIVDHDLLFLHYLSDKAMAFLGEPGRKTKTHGPSPVADAMNAFLAQVGITFRQEDTTKRPRANKLDSVKDREQKKSGHYFID